MLNFERLLKNIDLSRSVDKIFLVFLSFLLILNLSYCTEDVKTVEFTINEVERLLSGDTTKSWLRVAYVVDGQPPISDPCQLQTISTFYLDDSDTARYIIFSNPVICGSQSDTLETGYWSIIGKPGNTSIAGSIELVQQGDTVIRGISEITSLYLKLSGSIDESTLEVSYEAIIPD